MTLYQSICPANSLWDLARVSDNQVLLHVPKSTLQLQYYRDKAFSVAEPTLWNGIPEEIRLCKYVDSFKCILIMSFPKKAFNWLLYKEYHMWCFFILMSVRFRSQNCNQFMDMWYFYHCIIYTLLFTLCLYFIIICQENAYRLCNYIVCAYFLCKALEKSMIRWYISQWIIIVSSSNTLSSAIF